MHPRFNKQRTSAGITEYTHKDNGLTVLCLEDHTAPVLTFMVTYRVGSVNEVSGTTGATHLLEHMMFKGTARFNKRNGGHIDQLLGSIGAQLNATTWLDRTNYYETIPSEYLDLAAQIEADRMRNLLLDEADFAAEKTVVLNEYERGENDPYRAMSKMMWATAFQAHPYRHPTIGWRSDIENMTVERLRGFYDTFYWPDNSVVTLIGDFDTAKALDIIHNRFGAIPRSPKPIPEVDTREDSQQGARRFLLKRPGSTGMVGIAWKTTRGLDPDYYPLTLLHNILTGGKSSRLYRALIDTNLATQVHIANHPLRYPGLFIIYAHIDPEVRHDQVEEILIKEIEKVKQEGVTREEWQQALNNVEADTIFNRDGSYSMAAELNEAIAAGDWTFYTTFHDTLRKVSIEDIQKAARTYLTEDRSTTGHFIPVSQGTETHQPEGDAYKHQALGLCHYRPEDEAPSGSANRRTVAHTAVTDFAHRLTDRRIGPMRLLLANGVARDMITFRGSFPAGNIRASHPTLAHLTADMLDKGTHAHDKFALSQKLENRGAMIFFHTSPQNVHIFGRCLKRDIPEVIALLAEMLRTPAFDADELEKSKKQNVGMFKFSFDNPDSVSWRRLSRHLYHEGHPNYLPDFTTLIDSLDSVTADDLHAFHKSYYGNHDMIFIAAGDMAGTGLDKLIEQHFGDWRGGQPLPDIQEPRDKTDSAFIPVPIAGKNSISVHMGQRTGLSRNDEDFLPFQIGNSVLGSGFAGRLMSTVRDEEGLTYSIYASHTGDIYTKGYWYTYASFEPEKLQQGMRSIQRELKRWVEEGITQEELENAQKRLSGRFKVGMASTMSMTVQMTILAQRGLDAGYLERYPDMLKEVTREQVNAVLRRYIDPDKIITVAAGALKE